MHNDAVRAADETEFTAYSVVRPDAVRPLLLVCDHASSRIPAGLAELGLPRHQIERHIGWDIGAAAVTRALSDILHATAVLSGVSRLVVDCNRAPDDPTSIPSSSDGVHVPGNHGLTAAQRAERIARWFHPYHGAIAHHLARLERSRAAAILISIHSFTPEMDGKARPWPVGILWNRDPRLALPMIAALRAEGYQVGDNEPYSGRTGAHTVDTHAAAHGRPHLTVEIRQDMIAGPAGARRWATLLAARLRPLIDGGSVKERCHY